VSRLVARLAPVVAAVVLVAACGVSSQSRARVVDPSDVPEQLLPAPSTVPDSTPDVVVPPTPPAASDPVQVFFVRDEELVPVTRRLPLPLRVEDAAAAVVAGPDPEARAEGLRSALGEGRPSVVEVHDDGEVVVELTRGVTELSGREQRLALGQLVFTLTGLPGVTGVRFQLDGRPVPVPRGDGTLAEDDEPVDRDDYAELLAAP